MQRLLRTYRHLAHIDHWCDRCCDYIQPGDMYEGMVYASEKFGIITFKYHIDPICDEPKDYDYEENDLERTVKEEIKEAV